MSANTTTTGRVAYADGSRAVIDVAAIALSLAVVAAGFWTSFAGPTYLISAVGGILLGLVLAGVGARFRWHAGTLTLATVGALFLFGGALTIWSTTLWGIPTLKTLRRLATGVITSWKDFVTSASPLEWEAGHGMVPFFLLLASAVLAGSMALRLRTPAWALLPILAALMLEAGLGVAVTVVPLVQGAVLAVIAIGWLGFRHATDPSRLVAQVHGETTTGVVYGARARRLVSGAAVLLVASLAGAATGGALLNEEQRSVFRDTVAGPLDLREFTSPLQSFRSFVRDASDVPQLTVSGLPRDARVRLATMDAYDGTVLRLAGQSGEFRPLRTDRTVDVAGELTDVRIRIDELTGRFVPTVGNVSSLTFGGPEGPVLARSSYLNADTGTILSTRSLAAGDEYTMKTGIPKIISDKELAEATVSTIVPAEREGVPAALSDLASRITADESTPIGKVTALRDWLRTEGYFSHGLAGDAPSLSGHGAVRLAQMVQNEPIIGDDEQYAVLMTLMAGELGIPARAVMGWYPDAESPVNGGDFIANGENVHVWVEVAFEDYGWVAFDATPEDDKVPTDQAPQPKTDTRPQIMQPPPAAQDPAKDPLTVPDSRKSEDKREEKDDPLDASNPTTLIVLGVIALLLLLLLPFAIVLIVKAWRRSRRENAEQLHQRVEGGWDEVVDRARDLHVLVRAGATRRETAAELQAAFEGVDILGLASAADARVYGPGEPSEAEVASFWGDARGVIHQMMHSRPRRSRIHAKISLRSLRGRRGERLRRDNTRGDMGRGKTRDEAHR